MSAGEGAVDVLVVFARDVVAAEDAERRLQQRGYLALAAPRAEPLVGLLALAQVRRVALSRLLRARPGWADPPLVVVLPRSERAVLRRRGILLLPLT